MPRSLHPELVAQIDNWFVYHTPFGDQVERYQKVRDSGKAVAIALLEDRSAASEIKSLKQIIHQCCPESLERQHALDNLDAIAWMGMDESAMKAVSILRFSVICAANAAIACNESPTNPQSSAPNE